MFPTTGVVVGVEVIEDVWVIVAEVEIDVVEVVEAVVVILNFNGLDVVHEKGND